MNTDTPETDAIEHRLMQDAIEHIQGREALVFEFGGFSRNLERQRNEALAALEREQIRLAACGVVALSDTPDSAAAARKMHPDYESASCNDVARRVDECIALRQLARELRDALGELVAGVDGWVDDVNNDSSWDGWDGNFKHYAHGGLDGYRKTLTKATKLLP